MAPRANWKGFLRLSLVTRPVALYPATSESEKVSFNQLNRKTGHRIKYARVDADTGEEVANEDIVKGYKIDTDTFIEVTKEELENVALESTRTIEIDEFVDRSEIDPRYLIRPYYLVPDGKVGHDAFAVIRETIREMNKVACSISPGISSIRRRVTSSQTSLKTSTKPPSSISSTRSARANPSLRKSDLAERTWWI
jgi:DNA end-binding protein Ku